MTWKEGLHNRVRSCGSMDQGVNGHGATADEHQDCGLVQREDLRIAIKTEAIPRAWERRAHMYDI